MKKIYEQPVIELLSFATNDPIMVSAVSYSLDIVDDLVGILD